mmetsp:Transcript_73562/g.157670  ORF Transcript_73562/g.157670 Transcript_73562/m.157670 type:complete len:203 (+) Transcript_73562:4149-4757(+)
MLHLEDVDLVVHVVLHDGIEDGVVLRVVRGLADTRQVAPNDLVVAHASVVRAHRPERQEAIQGEVDKLLLRHATWKVSRRPHNERDRGVGKGVERVEGEGRDGECLGAEADDKPAAQLHILLGDAHIRPLGDRLPYTVEAEYGDDQSGEEPHEAPCGRGHQLCPYRHATTPHQPPRRGGGPPQTGRGVGRTAAIRGRSRRRT